MEIIFNNKKYLFSQYIEPPTFGLYHAVLTDVENKRCEIVYFNGEVKEVNELINE